MNTSLHLPITNPFAGISTTRSAERIWYRLGRLSVDALKALLFNLDVVYHTPIPSGAKLLCANHPTTIDPVMLTTLVPDQVCILISETLFKVPVLGASLAASGHIRVVHSNGRPSLDEGLRYLSDGRTVGIFPEGAISPTDGTLAHAHTGAARMAIASGARVIPIGIALDYEHILRVKTVVDGRVEVGTWYLSGPYAMTAGEPMFFSGNVNDRDYVQEATSQIAERIAELSRESARRLSAHPSQRALSQPAAEANL